MKAKKLPIEKIENCKECNGNPTSVSFTLTDFTGNRCEKCFKILNYERIGKTVKNRSVPKTVFNIQNVKIADFQDKDRDI